GQQQQRASQPQATNTQYSDAGIVLGAEEMVQLMSEELAPTRRPVPPMSKKVGW
ncbi:hypothetical protein HaLaN_32624, partial [Haematococcus lacustris]